MKASDLNLHELLEIDSKEGAIRFTDRRMLLWDADAFGSLRKELVDGLGVETARAILKRFGFANGYRDARMAEKLLQWDSDEDWWQACPSLQRHEGKVRPVVTHLHIDRAAQSFEMEVEWTHSYEAEQHIRAIGQSSSPVCWTLSGFASGYASALMGQECIVEETACVAMGDPVCKVVGRTSANWGARGQELASDYRGRHLSEELELREQLLRKEQLALARREQALSSTQRRASSNSPSSENPAMAKIFELCSAVAAADNTVLITGESGTGKERIALRIHEESGHRHGDFKSINCSALPEFLLESELFGTSGSSATISQSTTPPKKIGLFEQCRGGTLYLDEISEISNATQVKLLRALQEREIWPNGATSPTAIDVRVLVATSQDLEKLVASGSFRADLFYSLNVVSIEVPPLRARPEEILPLARKFVLASCARGNSAPKSLSASAAEALSDHPWPGNIRELQNAMERAVILSGSLSKIEREHLPPSISSVSGDIAKVRFDQVLTIAELEQRYTLEVLGRYKGNRTRTAKALGIGANTLWRKLKSWGVPPARGEELI